MTIEEATDLIYTEANKAGAPLSRDTARVIAQLLREMPLLKFKFDLPPGEVARYHRDRYDEDDNRRDDDGK